MKCNISKLNALQNLKKKLIIVIVFILFGLSLVISAQSTVEVCVVARNRKIIKSPLLLLSST